MVNDPLAGLSLTEAHKAAVRKQLTTLAAQNEQPALRQLATDVLAGKLDLRGSVLGPRYTEMLNESTQRYSNWYRSLSAEERASQESGGEKFAAEAHREAAEARRPARHHRPPADDDEWEGSRPILKKRVPRR